MTQFNLQLQRMGNCPTDSRKTKNCNKCDRVATRHVAQCTYFHSLVLFDVQIIQFNILLLCANATLMWRNVLILEMQWERVPFESMGLVTGTRSKSKNERGTILRSWFVGTCTTLPPPPVTCDPPLHATQRFRAYSYARSRERLSTVVKRPAQKHAGVFGTRHAKITLNQWRVVKPVRGVFIRGGSSERNSTM